MYLKVILFLLVSSLVNCLFCQAQLFTTQGNFRVDNTDVYVLNPNIKEIKSIAQSQHDKIIIQIPIGQKGIKTVELERSSIFQNGTTFVERHQTETRIHNRRTALHYSGKIIGSKNSMVAFSIFNNEILALFSFDNQNWNLQKSRTSPDYKLFHDDDILLTSNIKFCERSESNYLDESFSSAQTQSLKSSAMSSVDVYIECDYQMFTDFGSDVSHTFNQATSLLNTVNILYNMANINLNITQVNVWSSPDPYHANDANSSSEVLNAFKCQLDGVYNGRIAHLLSTTNQFGGLANRRDYCPYEEPLYAFSRIFPSFNTDISIYSWSVNVVAHEIGHNLSSPHTHSCSWNGNNTQIDDCANVYATSNNNDSDCDGVIDNIEEASGSDCFDIANPIIPAKGTIMSYCHLSSSGNGVDLSLGFHPEVAAKMKNYIDNCLSSSTIIYCPMPHEADLIVNSPNPDELELTCTITTGIDGYAWNIKPDLSCSSDTTIISSSNSIVFQGADPNTPYVVKCLLNCDTGPEWGEWSCEVEVSTLCEINLNLSGTQSDIVKFEKASNRILSTEMIQDSSFITYYYGNETEMMPGFEVQKASVFVVYVSQCQ